MSAASLSPKSTFLEPHDAAVADVGFSEEERKQRCAVRASFGFVMDVGWPIRHRAKGGKVRQARQIRFYRGAEDPSRNLAMLMYGNFDDLSIVQGLHVVDSMKTSIHGVWIGIGTATHIGMSTDATLGAQRPGML